MAWSPESDGLTSSYCWCSPDELDFSYSSFMESDDYDYDYDDDYDYDYDDDYDYDYDDDYDYDYNYDYEFDTHPELTDLTSSRKYFASRVPFRSDGNPRGKFPRKPLPWPARKLSRVQGYDQEADEYRNRLWQWELEQKQKRQRNYDCRSVRECIPDDLEDSVSPTTQEKITNNESMSKHDRRGPRTKINTTRKVNKKQARKERRKAQKARDKNKPRFEKPHYLLALDAMHRKKGYQKIWVGCPICNKIMAEWDGVMKHKSRELATRCQDGLWEAKHDCLALDVFDDGRSAFRGCDCGSCWVGSPMDPDYDRAHVEMWDVVDFVDSLGWETFRVRYVDRIGRGKGRAKEAQGPDPLLEEEEAEVLDVNVPDVNISIQDGTEDMDSIKLSDGDDTDTVSEEWDLLDRDSVDGRSLHGDARPDTVKSGKDTSRWATYMDNQRSGWTTNWFLGRWFG